MENKMQKHLTAVAALQVGLSFLGIVAAIIVYTVLMSVVRFVDEREVEFVLPLVAKWVSIFLLVISIPGIIGGVGLFMKKIWAKYLVLIISVFNLLNIPLGTAIAIYSIWVLVQDETAKLFQEQSAVTS